MPHFPSQPITQILAADWILAANEIAYRQRLQWIAYDEGIGSLHLSQHQLDKLAQLVIDRLAQKLSNCPIRITSYQGEMGENLVVSFPHYPEHACRFSLDRLGRERPLGTVGLNAEKR